MAHSNAQGFSLVELTIVLVIIGLLAGGVVAGSSMIRSAQVQSIGSDFQKYEQAVINFKNTYFALPGDMPTATAQWGVLAGTGSDIACQNTNATGEPTCNGNDNGFITSAVVANDERFRAWQHLLNADMIEGRYTGRTSGASGTAVMAPQANVPASRIDGAGFLFNANTAACAPCGDFFGGKPVANYIEFRAAAGAVPILKPDEAYMIDLKFDDERPGTGRILAPRSGSATYPSCSSSDDVSTATYVATQTEVRCVLDFRIRLE